MSYAKAFKGLTLAALCVGASAPAFGQAIIAPTSGVVNVGGPGFGTLTETFNQSGLSAGYTAGVTNFDTYIGSGPTHTIIFAGFEWFSNSGTNSAQVTYDFGSAKGIDRLALWNEESSGVGTLGLSYSLDGVSYSALGTFMPTNNPVGSNYGADVFSFGAVNARYVRFSMSGCPQSGGTFTACSIGEIAFRSANMGAVPEPATWAMMILGFGLVGGAMRGARRRETLATARA